MTKIDSMTDSELEMEIGRLNAKVRTVEMRKRVRQMRKEVGENEQ